MNASMRTNGSTLLRLGGGLVLLLATGSALASAVAPPASGVTYVYTDPQGTPLAEADVNGNITATFDYAPYGNQALGTAPNGPGYTGHVNDPDTGLVYMQARYYDPVVGRFISTDPVGPSEGNTFNFNRFAYAGNNPVDNIDPDGRSCTGSNITDSSGNCASTGESTTMAGNAHSAPAPKNSPSKNSAQYQAGNREANVVYHETAALRSIPGKTDDGDLHGARVDAAHVYNNLTDKSKFQDTGTLNKGEQKALAGGYPPAVRAYNDSVDAVSEAAHQADTTNGSTHFFVRDITAGDAERVPSWANGNQISYGPFRTTAAGDGPIHQGDTVYIWINNTR